MRENFPAKISATSGKILEAVLKKKNFSRKLSELNFAYKVLHTAVLNKNICSDYHII